LVSNCNIERSRFYGFRASVGFSFFIIGCHYYVVFVKLSSNSLSQRKIASILTILYLVDERFATTAIPRGESLVSCILGLACTLDIRNLTRLYHNILARHRSKLLFLSGPLWRCYPYSNALMPCWLRINNNESTNISKNWCCGFVDRATVNSLLFYLLKVRYY